MRLPARGVRPGPVACGRYLRLTLAALKTLTGESSWIRGFGLSVARGMGNRELSA